MRNKIISTAFILFLIILVVFLVKENIVIKDVNTKKLSNEEVKEQYIEFLKEQKYDPKDYVNGPIRSNEEKEAMLLYQFERLRQRTCQEENIPLKDCTREVYDSIVNR